MENYVSIKRIIAAAAAAECVGLLRKDKTVKAKHNFHNFIAIKYKKFKIQANAECESL